MQVNELIRKAQTVVDCDGNKKAVQLDYSTWEELLELLEDIEDIREIDRVREANEGICSLGAGGRGITDGRGGCIITKRRI